MHLNAICTRSVEVDELVVERPHDWVIHEISIGGRNVTEPWGDIPSSSFTEFNADKFVPFGTLREGIPIKIVASYFGDDPRGKQFRAEFRGQEPDPGATSA